MHTDPLVHLLPEQLHQALQVSVVAEYVVLGQHTLEAFGGNIPLFLQIHKIEVVGQGNPTCVDLLLCVVDVGLHVCCQG